MKAIFAAVDKRRLWLASGLGLFVEGVALRVLSNTPLDIEPLKRPPPLVEWAQILSVILHLPALPLLFTPLTNQRVTIMIIFFLIGYIDFMIVIVAALLAIRKIRYVFATKGREGI